MPDDTPDDSTPTAQPDGGSEAVETDPEPAPALDTQSQMEAAEKFFVKRDEDGDLLPVTAQAGGYGEVTILPMVYGQAERYFGDVGQAAMVGPDVVAEVLRNHVIDPDLNAYVAADPHMAETELTGRIIAEEMEPFGPAALLQVILKQSGLENADVDVDAGGTATVDLGAEGK